MLKCDYIVIKCDLNQTIKEINTTTGVIYAADISTFYVSWSVITTLLVLQEVPPQLEASLTLVAGIRLQTRVENHVTLQG